MVKRKTVMLLVSAMMLWAGSVAEHLTGLDHSSRENAMINLEWSDAPTENMKIADNLWNTGRYDEALAMIKQIEQENSDLSVAVTLRKPVTTQQQRWGDDVKVNNSFYSHNFYNVELVRADNGNLFVVAFGEEPISQDGVLAVFVSSDGGFNWSLQWYAYSYYYYVGNVDAAERPGFVYMNYIYDENSVRVRRFFPSGFYDEDFGVVEVFGAFFPESVKLEPDRFHQYRLYCAAIVSSGNLYFYHADSVDPTIWDSLPTGITNAERGLDMDYGYFFGSGSGHYYWLSYVNTDNQLCAMTRTASNWDYFENLAAVHPGYQHGTAVAAHGDTVVIFYIKPDNHIAFQISYNGGLNWFEGGSYLYTGVATSADVTARGHEGFHASFRGFYVSGDLVFYSQREYLGGWTAPQSFSEHNPDALYKTSIEYLGSAGAYGIVYIDDDGDIFFDRTDWQTPVCEYSDDEASSSILSIAPNPWSDVTKLMYTVQTAGNVLISVFDAAGRHVKNLVNEMKPVGTYKIHIDNKNLSSGIYFVQVRTADHAVTEKMIVR